MFALMENLQNHLTLDFIGAFQEKVSYHFHSSFQHLDKILLYKLYKFCTKSWTLILIMSQFFMNFPSIRIEEKIVIFIN